MGPLNRCWRKGRSELLITNVELRILNYELRIINYELRVMKENNIIQDKSFAFAIRIVNLYKYLKNDKQEFVLSKQILRSGTSIGSNVEEAIGAQSTADFLHKLSIAYKEARETRYWLKLIFETDYIGKEMYESLLHDAEAICKIIGSIQIAIKNKKQQ